VRAVAAELLVAVLLAMLATLAGWFAAGERGAVLLLAAATGLVFLRQLWMVVRLIRWAGCPLE